MFVDAIENQDMRYFLGGAVSAYLKGEEDSIHWVFKKMDVRGFKECIDVGRADCDTLLIRGLQDKINALCQVFLFLIMLIVLSVNICKVLHRIPMGLMNRLNPRFY